MSTAALAHDVKSAPPVRSGLKPLPINRPGDMYEQEAERVARDVVSGRGARPAWSLSRIGIAAPLQRECSCGGSCDDCKKKKPEQMLQRDSNGGAASPMTAPLVVHDVLRGAGNPLDRSTRSFMESRFGHDFSSVRIFNDDAAARSARSVSANAYTVGDKIVFNQGRYAPESHSGKQLLAHELTHVVQQGGAKAVGVQVAENSVAVRHSSGLLLSRQELTEQDAATCSPLYLQKLCVNIEAGFGGDRSGVPTDEEMKAYDQHCREESGYETPGTVELSNEEIQALKTPKCDRGNPAAARAKAHSQRVSAILDRAGKYMLGGAGTELIAMVKDPIFIGSLVAAVGVYLALWLAPEPVFSKIAAVATTVAILATGLFSWSMIMKLAQIWTDLESSAESAKTDAELEAAGQRIGQQIGAAEADLIVFIASLLIGGRIPGPKRLPPVAAALSDAERALAATGKSGVVIKGPWGEARIAPPAPEAPSAGPTYEATRSGALRVVRPEAAPAARANPAVDAPMPDNLRHLPVPKPAAKAGTAGATATAPVMPVVPGVAPAPGTQPAPKPNRPPFKLLLPQQKAVHVPLYRNWLGTLQSDPAYDRGAPAQRDKWNSSTRLGGSHAIPASVYEHGHRLGFTGEAGEAKVRIPDWSKTKSTPMEVDHTIELQVAPADKRDAFDAMEYYELLDRASNGNSGNVIRNNIKSERAKQVAFDPTLATKVLKFEEVGVSGGMSGERWSLDQIQAGEHLDVYENK